MIARTWRRRGLAWLTLLALLFSLVAASRAETADAPAEPRTPAIAAAYVPATADVDEKFALSALRRAKANDATDALQRRLTRQAQSLKDLSAITNRSDLSRLSVRRLESLERHWLLHERTIRQTRSDLARVTNVASEDAAQLATRRTAWIATREEPDLAPALHDRADELIKQIETAQAVVADDLAKLLDLGRVSASMQAQVQFSLGEVSREVEAQDRRLVTIDSPPLWRATRDESGVEPIGAALRESLAIESAFASDFDALRERLAPAYAAGALLLLPLLFGLRRRARRLVAAGQADAGTMRALFHPWAAWLLLLAGAAIAYDFQGPILRQQLVMLLAWIPVLALLEKRVLPFVGRWAYLAALFYVLNAFISQLVGDLFLYRLLLLGINLLMLAALVWSIARADDGDAVGGQTPLPARVWAAARWVACGVLLVSAGSNILGNVSLADMLVTATLNSAYGALAIYAGAIVVVSLVQVLLAGPTAARLAQRHSASLLPAIGRLGRLALVLMWFVFVLQSFRIYRPLATFAVSVLNHEFSIGSLTLSLGNLVAFGIATWAAFWIARTIREVLAEDVLPSLALPRGVGNSISSLSYYVILFLGLLSALAAAGFQVGQLTLIFGALGVGIGFGLQDVVRNFVAGLILMFERPIQRGDTVELAALIGTVRDIGLRATTITTFEGADVIIPNGMLLADKLVNWTLRGTRRRVNIDVSTVQSADPQRTIELLVEIARGVDGVASVPAPVAIMTGLATGVLEFNLRAWTTEHADWLIMRSDLAVQVRNGLAQAGIEVPLPQRELHVRNEKTPPAERPRQTDEQDDAAGTAPSGA